ncbi:MAG: tetratricopeptide repeat protein [Planctomycetes bacterium]|nr:tetratricopeptide repeat protein [Planctomycetota bacterium]
MGSRAGLRNSFFYGYNNYPYYGFNSYGLNSFYDYAPVASFAPLAPVYGGVGYSTYSAPSSPVYIDVNNYGSNDPNAYGSGGMYSQNGGNSLSVSQNSSPSLPSLSHRDLAAAAFYRGEYDLARRELIRAMLALPDDAELLMFYAYAHFATGDYVTAAQAIRRAIDSDPSLVNQPVDVAAYYGRQLDLEDHFERLERTIAANPYDAEFLFLAGYVQYAAGYPKLAVQIFDRAVSRAPQDLLTRLMRDASYQAQNLQRSSQIRGGDSYGTDAGRYGTDTMVIPGSRSRSLELTPEVLPTYPVESE